MDTHLSEEDVGWPPMSYYGHTRLNAGAPEDWSKATVAPMGAYYGQAGYQYGGQKQVTPRQLLIGRNPEAAKKLAIERTVGSYYDINAPYSGPILGPPVVQPRHRYGCRCGCSDCLAAFDNEGSPSKIAPPSCRSYVMPRNGQPGDCTFPTKSLISIPFYPFDVGIVTTTNWNVLSGYYYTVLSEAVDAARVRGATGLPPLLEGDGHGVVKVSYLGNYTYELALGYLVAWYLGLAGSDPRRDGTYLRKIVVKFYEKPSGSILSRTYFAPRDGSPAVDILTKIPFKVSLGPYGIEFMNANSGSKLFAFKFVDDARWYMQSGDMARLINYVGEISR